MWRELKKGDIEKLQFGIEVDGYTYHKKETMQAEWDVKKKWKQKV